MVSSRPCPRATRLPLDVDTRPARCVSEHPLCIDLPCISALRVAAFEITLGGYSRLAHRIAPIRAHSMRRCTYNPDAQVVLCPRACALQRSPGTSSARVDLKLTARTGCQISAQVSSCHYQRIVF